MLYAALAHNVKEPVALPSLHTGRGVAAPKMIFQASFQVGV